MTENNNPYTAPLATLKENPYIRKASCVKAWVIFFGLFTAGSLLIGITIGYSSNLIFRNYYLDPGKRQWLLLGIQFVAQIPISYYSFKFALNQFIVKELHAYTSD